MIWYRDLYAEESIAGKKEKIKWKIRHNAGMVNIYVITASGSPGGLLEIISTVELMQHGYPKDCLFIVGIAKGYEQARDLACNIILEIYGKTGDFQVKEYLLERQKADKSVVDV